MKIGFLLLTTINISQHTRNLMNGHAIFHKNKILKQKTKEAQKYTTGSRENSKCSLHHRPVEMPERLDIGDEKQLI